jgi:hypothetical protein
MKPSTSPTWLDLWSFGRFSLKLSETEFWHLTLLELDALIQRYKEEQDWLNLRPALICSTLANIHRDPKKSKIYKPLDFMPEIRKRQTPEDMLGVIKTYQALLEVHNGNRDK